MARRIGRLACFVRESTKTCVRLTPYAPSGRDVAVRGVMCCKVNVEESSGQMPPPPSPSNKLVPAPAHPTTESAHKYQMTEAMNSAYEAAAEKYHPHVYDRAAGWVGATYQEATKFCRGKGRVMCPFDAVCPLGTGRPPFGGCLDGANNAWVPVADKSNQWVNLSKGKSCGAYLAMYPMARHVACCEEDGGEGTAPIAAPAPSP